MGEHIVVVLPWVVLLGYGIMVWRMTPASAKTDGFFNGSSDSGRAPGLWLLAASAAISWVFAKSIANSAILANAFGVTGAMGYGVYYLSFLVAAVAIYLIRTKGGDASLPAFLIRKYGATAAKLFLIAIAIRLFNEVWSNTKVTGLYFGAEGSAEYWIAVGVVSIFTVAYSLKGGMRSSLLTDGAQMILAALLLGAVLVVVMPPVISDGLPMVSDASELAGLTFVGLAAVQIFSYPFHDPVMTDRGFLTSPKVMLKAFIIAGLVSGGVIILFGFVGLYALGNGLDGNPAVSVPASFGVPMLLVVNALMLTSAGSTLDSTFASTAKLTARDWSPDRQGDIETQIKRGRWAIVVIAIIGNLPLLSLYLGDAVGPAIIAATTISGTMVMGLAPIFLLAWLPGVNKWSFHFAFWPGLLFGVLVAVEGATGLSIFPAWIDIGGGKYADDLGVNLYGLAICTIGFVLGSLVPVERGVEQPA